MLQRRRLWEDIHPAQQLARSMWLGMPASNAVGRMTAMSNRNPRANTCSACHAQLHVARPDYVAP